jgi:tape measure domain-containing protein
MFERELQILVTAKNNATKELQQIQDSMKSLKTDSLALTGAFTAVTAGVVALGASMINSASRFEQSEVAFTTMLGSAQKAKSMLAEMQDFAKKTPFELTDIQKAGQTLLAFGLEANSILPNLKMIGDVAMGNKEKFNHLTLAFAQVQSTGRLMGQDLLQMVNQGFNPLQIISEKTGKSMASLKEAMEDGAISAEMVSEAFKVATSQGGRFFGGMEAQSKTFAGMVSNLADAWDRFLVKEGSKLLEWAKQITASLIYLVDNVLPALVEQIDGIIKWLNQNRVVLVAVATGITSLFIPAMVALGKVIIFTVIPSIAKLTLALGPYFVAGAVIGAVIYGIYSLIQQFNGLNNAMDQTAQQSVDYSDKISELKARLDGLENPSKKVSSAFSGIGKSADDTVDKVKKLNKEIEKTIRDYNKTQISHNQEIAEAIIAQQTKVSDLEIELQKKKAEAKKEITSASEFERISELNREIPELEKVLNKEREAYGEARRSNTALETEIAEAKRRAGLTELERKLEDIKTQRQEEKNSLLEKLMEYQLEFLALKKTRTDSLAVEKEYTANLKKEEEERRAEIAKTRQELEYYTRRQAGEPAVFSNYNPYGGAPYGAVPSEVKPNLNINFNGNINDKDTFLKTLNEGLNRQSTLKNFAGQ